MRPLEYILSVLMALFFVGGLAWAQASGDSGKAALSCRPGKVAAPVAFRGMNLYPKCPAEDPRLRFRL